MKLENAQRKLDRALRKLDNPRLDARQRRVVQGEIDDARADLRRAEEKTAAKLERQGYDVTPGRRGWL